jgi:ribose transport system permease protein
MPEMKNKLELGTQTLPASRGAGRVLKRMFAVGQGPVIGLILLVAFLCLTTPAFLSVRNYLNIIDQITRNGIVALGMTFVIIIGGIDLSVGSTFVLAMMTCGVLTEDYNVPGQFAIIGGLLAAALGGLVNGLLVTKARLPAFIATMAMMNVARGAANLISGLQQRYVFPSWFGDLATKNYFAAFPFPLKYLGVFPLTTMLFFALTIICWLFLSYRDTGRKLYAVGGNAEVARLSGVRVQALTIWVYVLSATLAGLAGIVQTSRLVSSQPYAGIGYELDAIAAVVIGGASLNGGVGTITGTVIGVLITGILRNGLNLNGVTTHVQTLLMGVVIAVTVAIDVLSKQKR